MLTCRAPCQHGNNEWDTYYTTAVLYMRKRTVEDASILTVCIGLGSYYSNYLLAAWMQSWSHACRYYTNTHRLQNHILLVVSSETELQALPCFKCPVRGIPVVLYIEEKDKPGSGGSLAQFLGTNRLPLCAVGTHHTAANCMPKCRHRRRYTILWQTTMAILGWTFWFHSVKHVRWSLHCCSTGRIHSLKGRILLAAASFSDIPAALN
jgi:hypothetical protein